MISIMFDSKGVVVHDNGKLITIGNSPQHFALAKNVGNYLTNLGYKVQETFTKMGRRLTYNKVTI